MEINQHSQLLDAPIAYDWFCPGRSQKSEESCNDLTALLEIHLLSCQERREAMFSITPNNTPITEVERNELMEFQLHGCDWKGFPGQPDLFQFFQESNQRGYSPIPEEIRMDPNIFRSIAYDQSMMMEGKSPGNDSNVADKINLAMNQRKRKLDEIN